jgi:hypothetical protein
MILSLGYCIFKTTEYCLIIHMQKLGCWKYYSQYNYKLDDTTNAANVYNLYIVLYIVIPCIVWYTYIYIYIGIREINIYIYIYIGIREIMMWTITLKFGVLTRTHNFSYSSYLYLFKRGNYFSAPNTVLAS